MWPSLIWSWADPIPGYFITKEELQGLFYNSSEVQDLRRRHGATLKVDIRVDESDIG